MDFDIDDQPFWEAAHECVSQYDLDGAEKIFQDALKEHANHPRILDALGGVLVQKGNFDKAKMVFNLSIKLAPEEGPEKYLNMGQLAEGKESLQYYSKAIEVLKRFMTEVSEEEQGLVTEQLISAYCSVAEIYMTDECFDPNAETECGNVLEAALKLDPKNSETLQTFASFKISQQDKDAALKYLTESFQVWQKISDPTELPEFEFRVQTAKLFMELDNFRTAADILESLLNEDDEISELWYLLGFSLATLEPESSLECLTKSRNLLVRDKCPEAGIFEQVDEQIVRVKKLVEEYNSQPRENKNENENVEDMEESDSDF